MKKSKSRSLALLLTAIMIFPFCVFSSQFTWAAADDAAGESGFDKMGSKVASPTKLGEDRKTTVTLEMPSGEYQNAVDIVFAMDSSTSAENSAVFTESVTALFDSIRENNPNLKLNVGVIRFRGRAHDAIDYLSDGQYTELVEYSDASKPYIEGALTMSEEDIKAAFGSGSNTHGGIDIANEWLEGDTELDDSHKYLVLLTDGKTYIWNNDEHEPTTIYSQWYRSNKYAMQNGGKPALNQVTGYNKYDYSVDVLDPSGKSNIYVFGKKDPWDKSDYEELYNSEDPELTGVSQWDAPCYYADDKSDVPDGTVNKRTVSNGAELFGSNSATYGNKVDYQYYWEFVPSGKWADFSYLEGNPFQVIENEDGTYTFDTENINPNYYLYHVDCLQKGMYKAGHLWSEVDEKYNTAVITYSGGSVGGGLELRIPFIEWLQDNSDYGADINNSEQVQDLFKGIDNSVRYMVAEGVVTDEIADEFTLDKPADGSSPFTMMYDGETLSSKAAGDNRWDFGELNDDGVYPYSVEYDEGAKTFKWIVRVPIENAKRISLSYDLILGEEYPAGEYNTNKSAVLDYVTTDGKEGTFEFEKPKVTVEDPEEDNPPEEDEEKDDPAPTPDSGTTPSDPGSNPPSKNGPRTGDPTSVALPFAAMLAAGLTMGGLARRRRKDGQNQ